MLFLHFIFSKMYEDADQEESMLEQQLSMETEYARHPHALKLFDPVPGMPVAVQREDTSWSRALIAQVLADQMCARVFYVDEGRYGRVSLSRLRYLRRELFTNEASPFRARLFGIRFSDAESEQQAFGFVYKTLSESRSASWSRTSSATKRRKAKSKSDKRIGVADAASRSTKASTRSSYAVRTKDASPTST